MKLGNFDYLKQHKGLQLKFATTEKERPTISLPQNFCFCYVIQFFPVDSLYNSMYFGSLVQSTCVVNFLLWRSRSYRFKVNFEVQRVGENKKTQFVVFKNEIYSEAKAIAMR